MRLRLPLTTFLSRRPLACLLLFAAWLGLAPTAQAQISGIKTIPGDYNTIKDAILALNAAGVGSGGVTFNIGAAGSTSYVETLANTTAGRITISSTAPQPTSANQIIFQKNPANTGATPVITAGVGASTSLDAIFTLNATDYVTFDGINLIDPSATNTTATTAMEFGFLLARTGAGSTLDGCNNITIKNCSITLQRAFANSTNQTPYGIASMGGTYLVPFTILSGSSATAAGQSSNNKFYSNTIQNVNAGIYLQGVATAAVYDQSNDVGGTGASGATTGNTITNFGGIASTSSYGIRLQNQHNVNVANNTINNTSGGGTNAIFSTYGVLYDGSATPVSLSLTYNTVTLGTTFIVGTTVASKTLGGIYNTGGAGGTVSLSNNTVTVNSTDVVGSTSTTADYLVVNTTATAGLTMSSNTVLFSFGTTSGNSALTTTNYGVANTGAVTGNAVFDSNTTTFQVESTVQSGSIAGTIAGVYNSGNVSGTASFSSNTINHNNNSTARNTTGVWYAIFNSGVISGAQTINSNTWGPSTGTATVRHVAGSAAPSVVFIYNSYNGANAVTATGNTWRNITNGGGSNNTQTYGYYSAGTPSGSATQTITNNSFSTISFAAASPFTGILVGNATPAKVYTVTGNTVNGITMTGTSGATTVIGISMPFAASGSVIASNIVANLAGTGASSSSVSGISTGTSFIGDVYTNTIYGLSSTNNSSVTTGILLNGTTGGTINCYRNRVSGLSNSGTSSTALVNGITVASGGTINLNNNLVGNLSVPTGNSGAHHVIGINITGGTTLNVYYNTVALAPAATSVTYGSSGIYFPATGTVDLRNNIVTNLYNASGGSSAIVTAALRRASGTAGAVPNNLSSSNNNFYYSGTPSSKNLLYTEGIASSQINAKQDLATYKTFMAGISATTEQNSVSEAITFLNTTGLNGSTPDATFLHLDPTTSTKAESGGQIISITTDYDNQARGPYTSAGGVKQNNGVTQVNGGGTAPDIGADEGDFTPVLPVDVTATALVTPAVSAVCRSTAETISATFKNNGGSALDFTQDTVTVTVKVTKPNLSTQTFTKIIQDNTGNPTPGTALASAASMTVTLPGTLDMSSLGTYSFQVIAQTRNDSRTSNDTLATVTRTVVAPTVGTASATPTTFCAGSTATPTLALTASANGTVSWEASTSRTGPFTAITLTGSVAPAISDTTYYRAVVTCNTNTATSNVVKVAPSTPTVGTASATPSTFCASTGASPVLSLTTYTGTLKWQSSSTGAVGSFTDLSGGSTNPFSAPAITTMTYYQAVVSCGATEVASNVVSVTPVTPTISTNSPVGLCAAGTATLTATAPAGTTINWYDTNTSTTVLATGSSYAPTVAATRQYFVEASISETAGLTAPAASTTGTGANASGVVFTATAPFTLKTVTVYPTSLSAGTLTVTLYNSSGTAISVGGVTQTVTVAVPAGTGTTVGTTTPATLTLNLSVPAGTAMRLLSQTGSVPTLARGSTTFPVTSPSGIVSVTSGWNSGSTNTSYYYFYNWQIQPTACATGRTAVQVNVGGTTWTGLSGTDSSDWFDVSNWSACVPSVTVDATIPASAPDYPNLSTTATAAVKSLTIDSGARLSQSAGTLSVAGNLTNNSSTVTLTGGTVSFTGTGTQTLAGSQSLSFNNLTVSKAATDTVQVSTDQTVNGALTMSGGYLKTYVLGTSKTISLGLTARMSETSSSYVLGDVQVPAVNFNANGVSSDFGGIGLSLTAYTTPLPGQTTTSLPGLVTVTRNTGRPVYGVINSPNTTKSKSIRRQYSVVPTVDTNLNLDMTFKYADASFERNGISTTNFMLFSAPTSSGRFRPEGGTVDVASSTISLTGLDHLSFWTIGDAQDPLPVELLSFEAQRQGADVQLRWSTSSEKNNRGFEVQLSTDGRSFRTLDFVAGAGSSSTPREYSYLDREAGKSGLRYYRLHQLDENSRASFSPVRTVRFGAVEGGSTSLHTAPSPFQDQLTLSVEALPTAASTQLTMTDMTGRTVLQRPLLLPAGSSQVELSQLGSLPAGVYLLHVSLGTQRYHLKVVKN